MGEGGDFSRRGAQALRGRGRALQGRARRHGGGRHLALHAGRVHRPLPRPAPPGLEADQGAQADGPRGRLLARRREEHAAHADLRHRVLLGGRPQGLPRADRGGAAAGSPAARACARPLPFLGALAGLSALAPEGDGDLAQAGGDPPAREREARLPRGEDAAHLRRRDLLHIGALPEVRGPDVQARRRRPAVGDEGDELPGHMLLFGSKLRSYRELPRALRRAGAAAPKRADRHAPRPLARAARHAGRRAHLLHRATRSRTRSPTSSTTAATCTSCSA